MTDDLTVSLTVTHRVTRDGDPPDLTYFDDLALKQVYTLIGQDAADEGITTDDRGYVYGYSKERAVLHLSGPIPDQTPREGSVQGTTSWQLTADTHGAVGVDNTGWELRTDGDFDASGFTLSPSGLLSIDPQHARFSAIPTGGSQAFWLEIRGKDADGVLSTPGKTGPWTVIKVTVAGPDPTISLTNIERTILGSDTEVQEFVLAEYTSGAPGASYSFSDVSGVSDTLTITDGILYWPTSARRALPAYAALGAGETLAETAHIAVESDIGDDTLQATLILEKPGTLTTTDLPLNFLSTSTNNPHNFNLLSAVPGAVNPVFTFDSPSAAAAAGAVISGTGASWDHDPLLLTPEWIALAATKNILFTQKINVSADGGLTGSFFIKMRITKPVPITTADIEITVDSDDLPPIIDLGIATGNPDNAVYVIDDNTGSASVPTIQGDQMTWDFGASLAEPGFLALDPDQLFPQTVTVAVDSDQGPSTFDVTINIRKAAEELVANDIDVRVYSASTGPHIIDLYQSTGPLDNASFVLENVTGVDDTLTETDGALSWPVTELKNSVDFLALDVGETLIQTALVRVTTPEATKTFNVRLLMNKSGAYNPIKAYDPWVAEGRNCNVWGMEQIQVFALQEPIFLNALAVADLPTLRGSGVPRGVDAALWTYEQGYYDDRDKGVITAINPANTVWNLGQVFSTSNPVREGDYMIKYPPEAAAYIRITGDGQTAEQKNVTEIPGEYRFTVTSACNNGPLISCDRTGATIPLNLRDEVFVGLVTDYPLWLAGNIFKKKFLDWVKESDVLRLMTWGAPMATYLRKASQLVDLSHFSYNRLGKSISETNPNNMHFMGPCYEAQIALAAKANTHVWLCTSMFMDVADVVGNVLGDIRMGADWQAANGAVKREMERVAVHNSIDAIFAGTEMKAMFNLWVDYMNKHNFPENKAIYFELGDELWNGGFYKQLATLQGWTRGFIEKGIVPLPPVNDPKELYWLRYVSGYMTAHFTDMLRTVLGERGRRNEVRGVVNAQCHLGLDDFVATHQSAIDGLADLDAFAAWVPTLDFSGRNSPDVVGRLEAVEDWIADFSGGSSGTQMSDFYVSCTMYWQGWFRWKNGKSWLGNFATEAEHIQAMLDLYYDVSNPGYTEVGDWMLKKMWDWVVGVQPEYDNLTWQFLKHAIHEYWTLQFGANYGPCYEGGNHQQMNSKLGPYYLPEFIDIQKRFVRYEGNADVKYHWDRLIQTVLPTSGGSNPEFGAIGWKPEDVIDGMWRDRPSFDLNDGSSNNTVLQGFVAQPFDPSTVSGLGLWLDPSNRFNVTLSGSNVTTLTDMSAAGSDATATSGAEPTLAANVINGRNALSFNGTDQFMSFNGFADDISGADSDYSISLVLQAARSGVTEVALGIGESGGNGGAWFGPHTNSAFRHSRIGSPNKTADAGLLDTRPHIVTINHLGTTIDVWFDGFKIIDGVDADTANFTVNRASLGAWLNDTAGNFFQGYIGEVIGYTNSLSEADVKKVQRHLATRWLNLPDAIDVMLGLGQSNMAGQGDSGLAPVTDQGFEWASDAYISPLTDPVGGANTGSLFPSFNNAFYNATGRATVCHNGGVGASALLDAADNGAGAWEKTASTSLYAAFVADANALIAKINQGSIFAVNSICALWHQGNADATSLAASDPGVSQANYQAALTQLFTDLDADVTGGLDAFYVIELGAHDQGTNETQYAAIRTAQADAATATTGMYMVSTIAKSFPAASLMADDLHYTQEGYNQLGADAGANVAALGVTRL